MAYIVSDVNLVRDTIIVLSTLPALIISVGVAQALLILRDSFSTLDGGLVTAAMFLAVMCTLVPFYHGDAIYMLRNYSKGFRSVHRGAPILDMLVILAQSLYFYAMLAEIQDTVWVGVFLIVLLMTNVVWTAIVRSRESTLGEIKPDVQVWEYLNVIAAPILVGLVAVIYAAPSELPWAVGGILAVCVVRTILDYHFSYRSYFPTPHEVLEDAIPDSAGRPG